MLDGDNNGDGLVAVCSLPHAGGVARFSPDGKHLALGADDGTVRVAATGAAREHWTLEQLSVVPGATRTYSDHAKAINDVDFHPRSPVLVSASADCTMRFFDYASGAPRASRQCTDTHAVHAVAFHPSGDHLLAATEHHAIHLYDAATFRCYLAPQPSDHHLAPVADARWSADGSLFASCGGDAIKVWDGVTNRCVRTIASAHLGAPVNTLCFGGGGRTLLSCGADSCVRQWDVGSGKLLRVFEGAQQTRRTACCFSHDEALVLSSDEKTGELVAWEASTGAQQARYAAHSMPVRWLAHSPVEAVAVSCGDDGLVHLWASAYLL